MELRLEVDQEQQHSSPATAVLGESALQIQAFARPRSGGVWDDIRSEIAAAIDDAGRHGRRARPARSAPSCAPGCPVPVRTAAPSSPRPASSVSTAPAGSCAACISGRGAIDEDAAEPLLEVFRETVVVRGTARWRRASCSRCACPQEEPAPRRQPRARSRPGRRRPPTSTPSSADPRSPRCGDGASERLARISRVTDAQLEARRDPRAQRCRPRRRVAVHRRARRPAPGHGAGVHPLRDPAAAAERAGPRGRALRRRAVGQPRVARPAQHPRHRPGRLPARRGPGRHGHGSPTIFNPAYEIVPTVGRDA